MGTSVPAIRAFSAFTCASDRSIGFSQSTGLPAFTEDSRNSTCVDVGVAIRTPSTVSEVIASSAVAKFSTPCLPATSSADGAWTSKTPASSARGWDAMLSACMRPMRPQPSTEILGNGSSQNYSCNTRCKMFGLSTINSKGAAGRILGGMANDGENRALDDGSSGCASFVQPVHRD